MSSPRRNAPKAGSRPVRSFQKFHSKVDSKVNGKVDPKVNAMGGSQNEMSEQAIDIHINPFYHEVKNEIIQPGHFVACSRYFVQRWIPRLGGVGAAMVLYLRSLGYYNPQTGERRDGVQVSLKQIAEACSCSDRTVQRELDRNEALQLFVKVEPCYHCTKDGRPQRLENVYRIAMDDPLAPEDNDRIKEMLADRASDKGPSDKGQPPISTYPAGNSPAPRARRDVAPVTTPTQVPAPMASSAPMAHSAPAPARSAAPAIISMYKNDSHPAPVEPASRPSARMSENASQASSEEFSPRRQIDAPSIVVGDKLSPPSDGVTLPSCPVVPSLPTDCQGKEYGDKMAAQSNLQEIYPKTYNTNTPTPAPAGPGGVPSSVSAGGDLLVVALCSCGVTAKAAQKLVTDYPHDLIRKQIAALAHRQPQDPGAALVSSIRNDWALPAPYLAAEKEREEKKLLEERRAQLRQQNQQESDQRAELEGRLKAYWDGLSPSEQEAINRDVVETLKRESPFLSHRLERGEVGGALRQVVSAQREKMLSERLGL